MAAGMPTTAPTSAPIGHEPAAQPTSAPRPMLPAVVPTSTAPAPAGSRVWRDLGSIRGEHTRLCNSQNPHGLAETAKACSFGTTHVEIAGGGPRIVLARQRRVRWDAWGAQWPWPSGSRSSSQGGAVIRRTHCWMPFETLRDAAFATLVFSGGHHPAFDAVCALQPRPRRLRRTPRVGVGSDPGANMKQESRRGVPNAPQIVALKPGDAADLRGERWIDRYRLVTGSDPRGQALRR